MPEPDATRTATEASTPTTAAVLYSAGSDSSLVAIRMASRFERIHLLTFRRRGMHGAEHVQAGVRRLTAHVHDPDRFVHRFVGTDRLCRHVMYERYWANVRRHGRMILSMCGLCKVSFHWRALVYCLDHGIRHLADGAVRVANVYPEQNEAIMLGRLRALYGRFGIAYETPIYEDGDRTEQTLYDLRYTRSPKVKGTRADLQFVCEHQVLYAMFLRTTLPRMPFQEFERRMAALYDEKLDMVEAWTLEYLERGRDSRLAGLLEPEEE